MISVDLKGKVALITGGEGFFGNQIASSFLEAGADVWVCTSDKIIRRYSLQNKGLVKDLRVQTPSDVQKAVKEAQNVSGTIDVLVNNTDMNQTASLLNSEPEDWIDTFSKNLDIPFLFCQQVIPLMVDQGEGYIVNISSVASITGEYSPAFASSMSALDSLTKGLSREYVEQGVRINGLAPRIPQLVDSEKKKILAGAVGDMAVILSSPLGTYINGQTIILDEGESIG